MHAAAVSGVQPAWARASLTARLALASATAAATSRASPVLVPAASFRSAAAAPSPFSCRLPPSAGFSPSSSSSARLLASRSAVVAMATADPREAPHQAGGKPGELPTKEQPAPGLEAEMDKEPDFGEKDYKGYGRLKDKVAIVTGGDSGIGRAVCLAYAREGADVVISYMPDEQVDADKTAKLVQDAGRQAVLVAGDLRDKSYREKLIKTTVDKFGRIDILVNNASTQGKYANSFEELDDDRVAQTFLTNVVPMFSLSRMSIPHMRPGASIINTASIQAYNPSPGILDYSATKGAIVTFSKGLSKALVGEKGIRVNVVAPGPVWTPLIQASFASEKIEKFGGQTPMGRAAQPKELSPAFVFLASEEGRFVNGEVLGVTGGQLLA